MPITKEKIGEVTFVNLTFGAGDINVTNGWEQDDKHSTILFLSQHHPKPEVEWDDHSGEWSKKPTGESKTSDTFPDGTIRLKFNKSKSVRIVIEHLIKIEQDLLSLETSK